MKLHHFILETRDLLLELHVVRYVMRMILADIMLNGTVVIARPTLNVLQQHRMDF